MSHDQSALRGIKRDSAAIADFIVDTLYDRFNRYLMIKKVQGLVIPNVIGENFAIYRACCNYVTIRPDKATFTIDEGSETFEPINPPVDKFAGDYIKKQHKSNELEG